MRDTSVSDDDLAIESAKQKLVTLEERPGYLEATRKDPPATVARVICLTAAAACGGIIYACTLYVTAGWLMWFLIVMFGLLGVLMLFATIGFSTASDKWGAAVVAKRVDGDKRLLAVISKSGQRHELDVGEGLYETVRPGDVGVFRTTGTAPDFNVEGFQRL